MNFSEQDIERILHKFDTYIKKVVKNCAINLWKVRQRRWKHERLMSELPDRVSMNLQGTQDIPYDSILFNVFHTKVAIQNEQLSKQLADLSEKKRQILLLYYFIGMTDYEIGQAMRISYENVKKTRNRTLTEMKNNWRNE